MRLISFRHEDRAHVGVLHGNAVTDATARTGITSMRDAIAGIDNLRILPDAADFTVDDIAFLPVVPDPSRILCIGLNYRSHVIETGRDFPPHPMIFTRWASSQVGHRQPILRPRESTMLDFEGELAVVIGKHCRRVPRDAAMSVVAGYSVYNDGSVRDWQRHSGQFAPGKNFPATGAFGPALVTAHEVPEIAARTLVSRLNGVEVQRATLDDLIFDIPTLIEYCSTFTPLDPGDVIVTGTPGGVGAARTPPLWMKAGDVVEVEIDGIGLLSNAIADG